MELSEYPCESLSFSGLGVAADTAAAAARALAEALNTWTANHTGHRLLQVTPMATPTPSGGVILTALVIHTVGDGLSGALAEQVAAVVEDALEETIEIDLGGSERLRNQQSR